MDALETDHEMLLLARAKELQQEYEHLVRSLEAAYENVRQLNAAVSENRSETKRVFQERLDVLALRRDANKRSADAPVACNVLSVTEKSSPAALEKNASDAATKRPRILAATASGANDTRRYFITYTKTKKGATTTKNDLLAIRSNSCDAVTPSTSTKQSSHQKRAVIKGYVGDEHSNAETNNVKTATLGQSVTQEKENSEKNDGSVAEVDLSFVKAELNDESNDCEIITDPLADDAAKTSSAVTLTTTPTLKLVQREPYEHVIIQGRPKISAKIVPKVKAAPSVKPIDEETLKRKRVMTRNRMRRWHEKKKLEEMTSKIANLCSKDKYSTMYTKVYY